MNEARNEYDDLSDLNSMEMESIREWEEQFKGKKFKLNIMFNIATVFLSDYYDLLFL